ncbi:MAG: lysostaphin resistance A-like protein [Armatimonadota bacterium]
MQTDAAPNSRAEFFTACVVGAVVSAATALVQYRWRIGGVAEYVGVSTMLLLWVPLMAVLLLTESQPTSYGLCRGDQRLSKLYGWGMFLGVLPILLVGSLLPSSREYYPLYRQFARPGPASWSYLIYFEMCYGWYLFCWEWFFRGYLLFGLGRGIGAWALFAQAAVFGLLHYRKPAPEFAASFGAGLVLGFAAMRTGSFLPGFLVHWGAAVVYDLLAIAWRGFVLPP